MLEAITQLLILQDRDRKIMATQAELAGIGPQRQSLQMKMESAKTGQEAARVKLAQAEASRKKCELEAEAHKLSIEKYSLQQFQTKKNEEYRALAHEIETCRGKIRELEDQQLEFMEAAEGAQKILGDAHAQFQEIQKLMDGQLAKLAIREDNLNRQLAELIAGREKIAAGVEAGARSRYERLLRHKGGNVVVGVERGVCGGCHMTLPPQSVVACQSNQELVNCPNCARILYYSPEMDLTVAQ